MATLGRRRALGQHFLKDRALCDRIAARAFELVAEFSCTELLEIGPGRGAITYPLLDHYRSHPGTLERFTLVERDVRLANGWEDESARLALEASSAPSPLKVILADFTEASEDLWLSKGPLAVVSNLPYSAGTAILTRLARKKREIPFMLLMFQAEVAQRLRAQPSTKAWGSLSLWLQNRWDVEHFASVPPSAFAPPPEVNSEVVCLKLRAQPRIAAATCDAESETLWEKLLSVCFAHRRKMLRSGLPPSGPWRNALVESGLDGTRRAESLEWQEWERLFEALLRVR